MRTNRWSIPFNCLQIYIASLSIIWIKDFKLAVWFANQQFWSNHLDLDLLFGIWCLSGSKWAAVICLNNNYWKSINKFIPMTSWQSPLIQKQSEFYIYLSTKRILLVLSGLKCIKNVVSFHPAQYFQLFPLRQNHIKPSLSSRHRCYFSYSHITMNIYILSIICYSSCP